MNTKIYITGTTRGLGKTLKSKLLDDLHEIIDLNRPAIDLENTKTLENLNLSAADVLILNAGHQNGGKGFFENHNINDWKSIVDCNVTGNLFLIQKYLQDRASGTIVIVTSAVIDKPVDDCLVYTASRYALAGAIYNLRFELQKQNKPIRIIEIRPGRMRETKAAIEDQGRKISTYTEVADAIIYALKNTAIDCIKF